MEKRRGRGRDNEQIKEKPEFEQKLVDLARVTRVTKGGKHMSFRAVIVLGDKKGKIGYGVAKGKDVTLAVTKAVNQAKNTMIVINLKDGTIPHKVLWKFGAARIMLKPAPKGTGVKAGGPVRIVLDLAGIENVVGKMMGSANKLNNVRCTYEALVSLREARIKNIKPE
jgi:small subunit ribosomal protein S5